MDPNYLTMEIFLKNYQLMRNLIHLSKENQTVVFLFPKDNMRVRNKVELIEKIIIEPSVLKRVKILYWEDLVSETLGIFKENNNLLKYFNEFKIKYSL